VVLRAEEIQSIAELTDFETKEQEWARDIWLFLYRCNGINFADFLRLKWSNRKGNYFIFLRKKTETTRKNNVKEIVVPISEKIEWIIEKYGKKDSQYVFGLIKENYTEKSFVNRSHKLRQQLNRNLDFLTERLNLSVPLKLKTARDSYATSLKRAGVPTSQIGEMLGHSNSIVTEHYLGSLDMEKTMEINQYIL
jgi:site-specific recombinase XerD